MPWTLDAYIQADALCRLEASLEATPAAPITAVLLRGVDRLWPFPPNYQLAPPSTCWTTLTSLAGAGPARSCAVWPSSIRGTNSDSAVETLLVRGLVEFDQHHLLVTTRAFLDFADLHDLADLPQLPDVDTKAVRRELIDAG